MSLAVRSGMRCIWTLAQELHTDLIGFAMGRALMRFEGGLEHLLIVNAEEIEREFGISLR